MKEIIWSVIVIVVIGALGWYGWKMFAVQPKPAINLSDLIVADSPKAGDIVKNTVHISGKARGTWYFEASFPVVLKDANGKVIAQAPAQAQGDWMTTDFVPFVLELTIPTSTPAGPAVLVLKKDNPSGLPEHDAQIEIPITISK